MNEPSQAPSSLTSAGSPKRFRLPSISGPLLGLIVVLAVFIALVSARGRLSTFLSVGNYQVLVHDNTIAAVAALGMLLIIISGGIDLSVGSVVALVAVVTMFAYRLVYAGPLALTLTADLAEYIYRDWGLDWRGGTGSVPLAWRTGP
jgi:ribose/xylose/arabinose/galactoside ABC-type transport system permease subunit